MSATLQGVILRCPIGAPQFLRGCSCFIVDRVGAGGVGAGLGAQSCISSPYVSTDGGSSWARCPVGSPLQFERPVDVGVKVHEKTYNGPDYNGRAEFSVRYGRGVFLGSDRRTDSLVWSESQWLSPAMTNTWQTLIDTTSTSPAIVANGGSGIDRFRVSVTAFSTSDWIHARTVAVVRGVDLVINDQWVQTAIVTNGTYLAQVRMDDFIPEYATAIKVQVNPWNPIVSAASGKCGASIQVFLD